jgi:lipopolysaccharide transport system ATP-binding protein
MNAEIKLTDVHLGFKKLHNNDYSLRRLLVSKLLSGVKSMSGEKVSGNQTTLSGINLHLKEGTKLGLVGRNGAGKSTLLRVMAGIYVPSSGTVEVKGRITTLLNSSFCIDHSLNGLENIKLGCALLNIPKKQLKTKIEEIIDFSELQDSIYEPVSHYSDGMKARLGFSIVTSVNPDILLVDEAIGAGDKAFIEKATKRINQMIEASALLVLATHDENIMRSICNKVALIQDGKIAAFGDIDAILAQRQAAA